MARDFQSVVLPSGCKTYEGVDPSSILICQLTGEDERILAETNTVNYDRKILEVLKNVVRRVDVEKLTVGDRLFILVWEMMNSFSNDLPVTYFCSGCMKEVSNTGRLSEMEIINLPESFKQPCERDLSGGRRVKLRLLTAGDLVRISDYERDGGDSWSYRYALSIVSDDDVLKRMEFYKSLGVKDTAKIRAFQEEFYHGPDMQLKLVCPVCSQEDLVSIPFRVEYLLPTGKELARYYGD